MTSIGQETFRSTLESIRAELGNRRNREFQTAEASPDELDRIQYAGQRDIEMGSLERDSNRLREVGMALRRINGGTFGICAGCEEAINPKRLAAIPWASSCIVCQEALDRGASDRGYGDIGETSLGMAA
jgi:DnaK suppressor protein